MSNEVPVDEADMEPFVTPEQAAQTNQGDRVRVDNPVVDSDEPEEDPITKLTPKERQQFRSLLTIGQRQKEVTVFDHKVVLSSLTVDDELMIAEAVKEYQGSQGFARAYQAATVAASIDSVDGESWNTALYEDAERSAMFTRKFARVRKMYPLVVQLIYQECLTIESEFADLIAKLGKR